MQIQYFSTCTTLVPHFVHIYGQGGEDYTSHDVIELLCTLTVSIKSARHVFVKEAVVINIIKSKSNYIKNIILIYFPSSAEFCMYHKKYLSSSHSYNFAKFFQTYINDDF